ncbi:hypothetical protein Zmor_011166 [Zophobas morio]|uniref:Uncharacterized protein n=1 Tax=Zophobas morio TaxID=2755281 RepID=A0AA38IQ39_9CUCU|nr:hypothetical protein Zmor_026633 [Zophobas morio]KAJ3659478.1 hypothetical protein Zmor_011166 [Zophobas morio]
MVHQPRWVEGWVVLYLFYKDVENQGGMDLSLEMALKFLDDPRYKDDDFSKREDLIWTSSICPKTIYFKASILLLKMRAYSWVENALACELKDTGIVHYMLAVICYYKKRYEHSLEHLEKARFFHGSDYPVVSLTGHCYLALGKPEQALYEYLHVLQSFERPDDMHLLYINCAEIMDNIQEARKILLIACKNHPTPYTWMACGIAYLAVVAVIFHQ